MHRRDALRLLLGAPLLAPLICGTAGQSEIYGVATQTWHIHHDILAEMPAIRDNKPSYEVEARLRLMAPIRDTAD